MKSLRRAPLVLVTAVLTVLFLGSGSWTIADAANPPAGTIGSTGPTLSWDGTAPGGASANEATCVDGVNCDTFTLTVTGTTAEWAGKVVDVRISWLLPASDFDLYIHKDSNSGPIVAQSGNGAPDTDEQTTFEPAASGTGVYTVHVVYFSVAGDQYHGVASVQPKPAARTVTYLDGGINFSSNVTVKAPVATRDGEPSSRTDTLGNWYVSGIRGVPAGVDLWYADLNSDPYLRNVAYRGQPDSQTCDNPDAQQCVGADGGGDVDLAVGLPDPATGDRDNPPTLAFSSLVLANVSVGKSTDKGVTFQRNPLGNVPGGAPIDDRQWNEFYGRNSVYLLYRTVAPAVTQIQRSDDSGLTYGPAATAGAIGQVGYIDVHQKTGAVYVSGSTGQVCTGIPPAPNLAPLTYACHQAAPTGSVANIFFPVKVADDGTPNGTVYVAYSDTHDIYLAHSLDQGSTWSQPVKVSHGAETRTSLLPWLETGPTPGSVGVVWYGSPAAVNADDADWKMFYAQSYDATATNPTFRQVTAGDHVIHGSNISTGGTLGTANRNLLDYFQVSFDPNGGAVIAYTDDHNDFDGHTFATHQIGGPGLNVTKTAVPSPGPAPAPTPPPADGAQVTDFAQDAASGRGLVRINAPDPLDILSIKYSCETGAPNDPLLVVQEKVSNLSSVPPGSTWMMNFTGNAPYSTLSPTGEYTFGLSDRGNMFFVQASTDPTAPQFSFGTAVRNSDGTISYTNRGVANSGSFSTGNNMITVKVALSKLNPFASKGALAPGSVLVGLRGRNFTVSTDGKRDLTRGGTQYTIGCAPPAADLSVTKTDSPDPLKAGQNLTYTITVRNNGPNAATGVTLTDQLPRNAGYGSSSTTQGSCSLKPSKTEVGCSLGTIASGATVTVTIMVKPNKKGQITNTATASATSPPDPNTANNTATATTTVE
jgi:uncharacterized repeat protein (TIGR01451 family)